MRDNKRITTLLMLLGQYWRRNPELRFGQLVMAVTRPSDPCPELFYLEDEKMIHKLQDDTATHCRYKTALRAIQNTDFILTEQELAALNLWAAGVAREMRQTDTESWEISVTFSTSNMGTTVEASSGCLPCNRVTIRE